MDCKEIIEKAKQAQEKGETKEAIELYKQAAECFDKAGESEQVAKTFYILGELYRGKKNYFDAASAFKDAIMRYSFSGNIKAAEEISKNIQEEEIKSSKTFQLAIEFMKERVEASKRGEELTYEEPLTDEGMEATLKEIEKKIEIAPADDKIYEILGGKAGNFIPTTERIQLKGKPTASQLQKLLRTTLENKRVRIKNEIISTITAKREKEDFEVSFKTNIEKEDSEIVAKVYFENSYEASLKDAVLTCYIPACYDVEKIDSQVRPKTKPALEGVEASFDFKKLSPKEKINVNFTLRRNISRTVIIGQGKEIWAIRTHIPIIRETATRFKSHLTLLNKTEKVMGNVILEDVIPLEFSVVEISLGNVQPYAKDMEDTLLQQILSNFGKNDKFEITYLLEPRKTIRIIEKQLQLKDGRNIGKLTKIIEPINKQGKSLTLVNIEFKNTTHTDLENVKIKDRIPITLKLTKATINPEITTTEKMYYLSWKFGKIMEEQSIEISYLTEGEEAPYKEIPEIELEGYQSYESRHISTDRYQGIIRESKELMEFKKQVT
nr:tetratricopeptide repeat protein [Candidatus Freyarchaeota archaeon]